MLPVAVRLLAPACITLVTGCATFTGGGATFDRVRATALDQAKADGGCADLEVASEADLKEVEKNGEKGQLGTIVVAGCGETWSYLTICAQTTKGSDCKAISTTPPVDPYEKNREAAVAEISKSGGCDAGTTEAELFDPKEMRKEDKVAHAALVTVTGCGSAWRVNTICGELKDGDGCMAFVVTPDEGAGDAAPAAEDDALKLDIDTDLNLNPDDVNVDKLD